MHKTSVTISYGNITVLLFFAIEMGFMIQIGYVRLSGKKKLPSSAIEWFRLEKTCKLMESNHEPNTAKSTTKLYP